MSAQLSHATLAIAAIALDGIWEGAFIAAVVWLTLRLAPNLGAATRYAIWLGTLVAIVIVPIVTAAPRDFASAPERRSLTSAVPAHEPATAARSVDTRVGTEPIANPHIVLFTNEPATTAIPRSTIAIPQAAAIAVTMLWFFFAFARVLRLVRDGTQLAAIRHDARPWSTTHGVPIHVSERAHVPLAIGFRHRAIVLPSKLVTSFANEDLDAIVIHELAHLRRFDVWTNFIARISEAIGALSPATWFAMRALSIEREIACDDWVVARVGSGAAFARTLAALAHLVPARAPIAAPSALGSRHAIVDRIERLLDARPRRLTYSRPIFGGTLVVLTLIALLLQAFAPALAYQTQSTDPPRSAAPAPPGNVTAGLCAEPNRGIRMTYLPGMNRFDREETPMSLDLLNGGAFRSAPGRPQNTTFEVTVDATGKLLRADVLSAPDVPGTKAHLTRLLEASTYEPALRNCVPFASTVRTSTHIMPPEAHSGTVITPIYPPGWSARYASACKVPTVTHARFRLGFDGPTPYKDMLPAFPDSERSIDVDAQYTTTIRVSVNGTTATHAVVIAPSGRSAFDESALLAARNATYPLVATTCSPLPTEYLWRTTFAYQVFP